MFGKLLLLFELLVGSPKGDDNPEKDCVENERDEVLDDVLSEGVKPDDEPEPSENGVNDDDKLRPSKLEASEDVVPPNPFVNARSIFEDAGRAENLLVSPGAAGVYAM